MHTRDKLTGTICKCMECGAARQQRLEREARIRYRETYEGLQQLLDEATQTQQAADQAKRIALKQQRALHQKVFQEIINEEQEEERLTLEETMEQ